MHIIIIPTIRQVCRHFSDIFKVRMAIDKLNLIYNSWILLNI